MTPRVIIKEFTNRFWEVAEITVINSDGVKEWIDVNKFYEVDKNWIYVFDTAGGQGTGYSKGKLLRKIDISNYELITFQTNG